MRFGAKGLAHLLEQVMAGTPNDPHTISLLSQVGA